MALPSPTALTATVPYTKFTTSAYLWVPTIAALATPTLAEVNAGKNLTTELTAVSGFTTSTASIELAHAGTSFTGSLPGRKTAADSSLTFTLSTAGPTADVRSVITEGLVGYIVICNEGIVTSAYCDIFPVRVGSVAVTQDLEAIAMAEISFYIYKTPQVAVAIPTA